VAMRDLLVYLDPTSDSLAHLELAVDLARRNRSSITALYVREWLPEQLAHRKTAELAGRPFADLGGLERAVEDSIDRSARAARSKLERLAGRYRLDTEWRMVEGEPRTVVPQHARYADLCVLDADTPATSTSAGYRFCEEMLFSAGRPVLLVPPATGVTTLGAHIAVAWNSSRSAARALNDALPLLEHSEKVSVIVVNPPQFMGLHGALPLPQLIEHLRRHGIAAQPIELPGIASEGIGAALEGTAREVGADLLVAGAHGHTWLHEVLLGSVTRELLGHLELPAMMSH
jgi:nucleotide-binding universal stress UspA family protein